MPGNMIKEIKGKIQKFAKNFNNKINKIKIKFFNKL